MKSIGRNFAAIILVVIFTMACTIPAFAKAGDVSLVSDVQNKSVSILGQLASGGGVNFIVNIANFSEDIIVFSEGNPPVDSRLFTTYQGGYIGRDADKGETIYFANAFPSGHYSMYIYYNEGGQNKRIIRSFFVIDESDTDLQTLMNNLNSATSSGEFSEYLKATGALAKVGIYDKDIASSGDYPMEYAYYMRPQDGYTISGLQTAINNGDVIYIIKTNGVEALNKNTFLLGSAYTGVYQTMSALEKQTLNQLLKTADYTSDTLTNVFSDMTATAIIKSCTNVTDMETAVKAYMSELGINMGTGSDYSNIADTKKYMVFEKMLNERSSYKSMADVKASFDRSAYAVLTAPTSPVTQNPGGGSTGTQTSGGNILNPGNIPSASGMFNDISGHFAKNDIEKLAKLGFINGNPDGSYKPDNNITRAEFAKLVAVMFGIAGGNASFYDINANDWFAPYVNALADKGIITGYNGYFNPNDNIKREDAVLMLQRAAKLFGITKEGTSAVSFADDGQVSAYAKDAVSEFSKMGIINGDGVNFYPLNMITRGEVAAVLSRLYDIYVGKGA